MNKRGLRILKLERTYFSYYIAAALDSIYAYNSKSKMQNFVSAWFSLYYHKCTMGRATLGLNGIDCHENAMAKGPLQHFIDGV